MIHEILPVGVLACNCSIFGDEQSRTAIVIDPGDDIADILALVARHQLRVVSIAITHAHIDHIGGAAKLKKATGAPVLMNALDQPIYDHIAVQASWLAMPAPEQTTIDTEAREGDEFTLGGTKFVVLETPGHTPGGISLWIPELNKVVAGDTTVPRQHRAHGSARRRQPRHSAVDPGETAHTARGRRGDSRARSAHHHRPRKAIQSFPRSDSERVCYSVFW